MDDTKLANLRKYASINLSKHFRFFPDGLTTTLKVNSDNSHLLISGNKKAIANVNKNCIESEDIPELPRIPIDQKLTFENHINKFCKRASQKLNTLAQISNYMAFDKRKVIAKAFITQLPLYVTYNHLIVHADYVQKKLHQIGFI